MKEHRPFDAPLTEYERQAAALLSGWRAADEDAVRFFYQKHPRFRRPDVLWLPKPIEKADLLKEAMTEDDARLAIAYWYDFRDWAALKEWVDAVNITGSPVSLFESAVDAVINGDAATLQRLLHEHPELVKARSTRVTWWKPPQMHRATLLHYLSANGVEGYREKTPANAVEIMTMLLRAGAEVDALADMYEGQYPALPMLVSSGFPAKAGLQIPLAGTLIDYGADIDGAGSGGWRSPLMTALAFGYTETAEALARRGARVDTVAAAAGLGRAADVRRLLPGSTPEDRHRAVALSAQHGRLEIMRTLLDAGEDPSRYNPPTNHSHSTPLHQAVISGRDAIVRLLVERGARLDIRDTIYNGTPLGWAEYCNQPEIAAWLRTQGAPQ
ncbi:MAG TPA: ankyrin repeat domain-containing protein [Vicinamibacterales bacterium]|nr:ankyrin repeat domain-containing protein [Vicinamibacterales bacterium]